MLQIYDDFKTPTLKNLTTLSINNWFYAFK